MIRTLELVFGVIFFAAITAWIVMIVMDNLRKKRNGNA